MATHAPITGAPTRAPSMPAFSRRALLGALAVSPAIAGSLAVGADAGVIMQGTAAMNMQTSIVADHRSRSHWEHLQARLVVATAELDRLGAEADMADDRYQAERPGIESIDFRAFTFMDRNYVARVLDLDARWAEWLSLENKTWFTPNREATIAREKASYDSVRAFRKATAEVDERVEWTAANDRYEDAMTRRDDIEHELITMSAPDTAAFHWKLDRLFGAGSGRDPDDSGSGWCAAWMNAIMADAHRLLADGRA